MPNNDLAVMLDFTDKDKLRLKKTGEFPVFGCPKHFMPGGLVAIVSEDNVIRVVFRALSVEGPQKVILQTGKLIPNGYIIRADKRTINSPDGLKSPIRVWHAIGQMRYLDLKSMIPKIIGNNGSYSTDVKTSKRSPGVKFHMHSNGIPGLNRNNPEAKLVDEYVSWVGEDSKFGHNYIRGANLFVDLFDLTRWMLIEAKVSNTRETIRMAVGQLSDYKRFYSRPPSLAVLLTNRPPESCNQLLRDNRINVIWKTSRGEFKMSRWRD